MSASVLDGAYEAGFRAMIMLFLLNQPTKVDYLGALDTLAVNAASFRIAASSLNGTHRFASGELQTRTKLIDEALRELTLRQLTVFTADGFMLTRGGVHLVNQMHTPYADRLFASVLEVLEHIAGMDTVELTNYVSGTMSVGSN